MRNVTDKTNSADRVPDSQVRNRGGQIMDIGDANQWQWNDRDGHRWLTCKLLQDWPHAFGSRHTDPKTPDLLSAPQLDLEGSSADWTQQVHGNCLAWSDDMFGQRSTERLARPKLIEADAIATERLGKSVWVRTADCVPVLLADRERVAAIHSGWRGTASEIVAKTVTALVERGSLPTSLRVAIGPAISGPVYQVSCEVADRVLDTIPNLPYSDILPVTYFDDVPGKVRLDLRAAIVHQLLSLGIRRSNICLSPHCTWSDPDNFFSYRRLQSPPSPVQWSGIGLAN